MTSDFTLDVFSDNGFNILNRMINICNRRRVRIRSISAFEFENVYEGAACFVMHTTYEMAYKVQQQIDNLIEVERTLLTEGEDAYHKVGRKLISK
jgi:acetolactate synthase small subunit